MEKKFEYALKNKIRFNYRGVITTEDLFDLNMKELDFIYKDLMNAKKENEVESLMNIEQKTENELLNTKIEIVKYIFNIKVEAKEAAEKRAENAAKKQKILEILARKQDAELESKSAEELQKLLNEI